LWGVSEYLDKYGRCSVTCRYTSAGNVGLEKILIKGFWALRGHIVDRNRSKGLSKVMS
jgi:hypothetical protein